MIHTPPTIMPGGEPFFYRGGATGCLCLHGFTASPAEIKWLGQHLAGQGLTIYGPRLAGHAADYRDMSRMRWTDWFGSVLDGYHILRQQCERVFVAGHSMGGMLALLLAANQPVDGVMALAAPVIFESRSMAQANWLKYIRPFTDQSDQSDLPERIRAEQTRRGEPPLGRVRYDTWSTSAVAELFRLAQITREQLPRVTAPLLVIYSGADRTVPLINRDVVLQSVQSRMVEQYTLQHSDHILIQDSERDTVFAHVADFIAKQQPAPPPSV